MTSTHQMTWDEHLSSESQKYHYIFSFIVAIILPLWTIFDYFVIPEMWQLIGSLRFGGAIAVALGGYLCYKGQLSPIACGHLFTLVLYVGVGLFLPMLRGQQFAYWCIGYSTCFVTTALFQTWPIRYHIFHMVLAPTIVAISLYALGADTAGIYIANGLWMTMSVAAVSSGLFYVRMGFLHKNFTLINEKITLQAELAQYEKISSLGTLVAGVSHELNTPLGIAVTSLSSFEHQVDKIKDSLKNDTLKRSELEKFISRSTETFSLVYQNVLSASELVKSFKRISVDVHASNAETIDLDSYVKHLINTISPLTKGTKHRIIYHCHSPGKITSVPSDISSILTNLVNNALIHGFKNTENGEIVIEVGIHDADYSYISVSDNGSGIDETNISKIFDPFFTTNRTGDSSGLGLNIVFNTVTKVLGGKINVESEVGKGTKFTVYLPVKSKGNSYVG